MPAHIVKMYIIQASYGPVNGSDFAKSALAKSSRQAICLFSSWKAIVRNTKKPDDLQIIANHPVS
ncbi:MAG: hypothetical protein EGQ92_02950 [Lactobacillus ruminis]|nr:hypothetical protein [Ligilactobacillus ruminis]